MVISEHNMEELAKTTRERGIGSVMVGLGLFLTVVTGIITASLAPSLLHPGAPGFFGVTFSGTPEETMVSLVLFGLLIVVGLTALMSGLRQIRNGRPGKRTLAFMTGLLVMIVAVANNTL
jgi:hypothetical protein